MKALRFTSVLLSAVLTSSMALAADDAKVPEAATAPEKTEVVSGQDVYETNCIACHVSEGMPTVAPPIFAVKNHVIGSYPEREDFIKRVAEWVKAPNAEDVLMPGAVRKFGLMPALPQLSDEEAQAVAAFLFDSDMELPDWYAEHYKAEHGEAPKTQ